MILCPAQVKPPSPFKAASRPYCPPSLSPEHISKDGNNDKDAETVENKLEKDINDKGKTHAKKYLLSPFNANLIAPTPYLSAQSQAPMEDITSYNLPTIIRILTEAGDV
jgi:hypothetical protein